MTFGPRLETLSNLLKKLAVSWDVFLGYTQWIDLRENLTGNHRFSPEIWDFPVKFPLNQPIDIMKAINAGSFHGFLIGDVLV